MANETSRAGRSSYSAAFTLAAKKIGRPDLDAGELEAWARLQYSTLDHLSETEIELESAIAADCIDADPAASRALAESMGLGQ